MALISLVDDGRQWFKSRIGMAVRETPRSQAFCAYALHSTEPLIVLDTLQDIRFADNPLVTGSPGLRFYAGAPLITKEGLCLGTFCVLKIKIARALRFGNLPVLSSRRTQSGRRDGGKRPLKMARLEWAGPAKITSESIPCSAGWSAGE